MGGTTVKIEEDILVVAIEKLREQLNNAPEFCCLDSISIFIKTESGEYTGISNNGIEVGIASMIGFTPTKNCFILYHLRC